MCDNCFLGPPVKGCTTSGVDQALLRAHLQPPEHASVSLTELGKCWRRTVVTICCDCPAGLDVGYRLPARIRGAWGRVLRANATSRPPTRGVVTAHDVFFSCNGMLTRGKEIPKPFVVACSADGKRLNIELTLFGFADHWLRESVGALVAALQDGGVAAGRGRDTIRLKTRSVAVGVRQSVDWPKHALRARLRFVTPLALLRGKRLESDYSMLFSSLEARVRGLARWQGRRVWADWLELMRCRRLLRYEATDTRPHHWRRHSIRGGPHFIGMKGFLGELTICTTSEASLDPFIPLLALGETCHAGANTTMGLGRYRVSFD